MLNISALINSKIEGIITTFVGHYPTNQNDVAKVYPYAEINFPNIVPNNTFSDKNLMTIDVWDDKDTNIIEIEGLSDSINKVINRLQYIDVNMKVSVNKDTPYKLDLGDPALYIQRQQLRYIATVYYNPDL